MKTRSKILFLDIETAPNLVHTWGFYEQNVIEVVEQWYILCFAYKWLGEKTQVVALPDFENYKPGMKDENLTPKLREILDQADIIVAQNGDRFDIPKINTRLIQHKLQPPSPYQTVDTLKAARKFAFNSNKMDNLGRDLGEGRKVNTGGFGLWKKCMAGDQKAWARMKRYNKQDVDLLERLYLRLRPWIKNHPNVHDRGGCPKCGSTRLTMRGRAISKTMEYIRYQCQGCGGWSRSAKGERIPATVNA